MNIKLVLRNFLEKKGLLEKTKNAINKYKLKRNLTKRYTFENRMKNKDKVCIILAGYKEFLYDIFFERIKKFVPEDVEVCILSSGKYSERLSKIAEQNDWSYLSMKRNNVSLIQNVAINLFKNAQYIYKIDEDIFVTKNYFETLMNTMRQCEKSAEYKIGFVAPTIPINGYGHLNVLKRFGLVETYKNKFENPIYSAGKDRMIESNPEVAKFFWGEENYLPNIDEMNKIVQNDEFGYEVCPIRFSIGAILFKRELWQNMNGFKVSFGNAMGRDEIQICGYCMVRSRAIIVSNNSIVGHLSFGNQNKVMKEYFENNQEIFKIHRKVQE